MASLTNILTTSETPENKPLGASERNIHKKPTIVKVPPKASDMKGSLGTALAEGSKTVGDGFVSAVTSSTSAVSDAFSKVNSSLGKAKGAIADASSAASDPLGALSSLASEAFGFSVPTSPEGVASLLSSFAPPSPLGDGTSLGEPKESISEQLSKVTEAASQVASLDPTGSISSLTSTLAGGNVASLASSVASSTNSFSSVTSAIGNLQSGGFPVDNVISTAFTQASNPVQSSLQKVINKTDGTAGVII